MVPAPEEQDWHHCLSQTKLESRLSPVFLRASAHLTLKSLHMQVFLCEDRKGTKGQTCLKKSDGYPKDNFQKYANNKMTAS